MDANDAEARIAGKAAIGRELGARRKILALLLTHTLLTGACIAFCVYTFQSHDQQGEVSLDRGIYLNMLKVGDEVSLLNFHVTWNKSMELKHQSEVNVEAAGPYIFYVCAIMDGEDGSSGNLTLRQGKNEFLIQLQFDREKRTVRHERLISLFETDVVSFTLQKTKEPYFDVKELRIGLHYMLGTQTFKTPVEE